VNIPAPLAKWFQTRGWQPFAFQTETWAAYLNGESGLIHASTGTGKTYAAYLGPVIEALQETPANKGFEPLRILWITPLRALSADTALALDAPIESLGLNWDVGVRTGDTSASQRTKQSKRLPTVLVTTPESLALFLTHEDCAERFANLRAVIVDEWHELLSSKRGVLVELALARLRKLCPHLRTWGLSATLGNLPEALCTLMGHERPGRVVRGKVPKLIVVDAIIPETIERFPWAGHLGLTLVPQVVAAIEEGQSALVFTNTRAQAELWYQSILQAKPEWAGVMALHHGSLDRKVRDWVEDHLRDGSLRCVVSTSSLDLGVDFSPVDRVLQIGSPKGVARLLQRAGRSGHNPGRTSRVTCVPTNAFELIEIAAARGAVALGKIESRVPFKKPLDVLAQHAVSCALAGGFDPAELYAEVCTTSAYAELTLDDWHWVLDFVARGGEALRAYTDFRRVTIDDAGRYTVTDKLVARRHRMAIGTIVAEASILVRFQRGAKLGSVEESFAAKLQPGDRFMFAGKLLEFIRLHEQTAWVKKARGKPTTVPRWMGGRMPLSSELAEGVREQLDAARRGIYEAIEMQAARPILETQAKISRIPGRNDLLVERLTTRDGHHLFLYPFEGRLVHEGLAALLAYRISRLQPLTLSLAVNDYGVELLCHRPLDFTEANLRELLAPAGLQSDILMSLNTAELSRRQFREVARVAGLVSPGLPHAGKSTKQLQASASLFFNVFVEYDPDNLLLQQARREVLDRQFEEPRLRKALERMQDANFIVMELSRPSPMGFPLLVERLRASMSSEKLADRVRRMAAELERKS
jgi:ATP-dependent helicase Lhr and Lhr-like helicase